MPRFRATGVKDQCCKAKSNGYDAEAVEEILALA